MDIEKVRELVQLMVDNDLAELDVTDGENKIKLRRGPGGEVVQAGSAFSGVPMMIPTAPSAGGAAVVPAAAAEPEAAAVGDLLEIKSPMVGTYFSAASPEAGSYVDVGADVNEETVVCIVEAMKVMNEIKAECAGAIVEVCVKNAQPVEYGQVLFRVRPA